MLISKKWTKQFLEKENNWCLLPVFVLDNHHDGNDYYHKETSDNTTKCCHIVRNGFWNEFGSNDVVFVIYFCFLFHILGNVEVRENKKLSITIAMVLTFAVAVIGYKAIVWHRGTIAWAYFISFPFGVLWAKNRQRIVSNKVWGRVLIIIVGLCSAFVVINYGKQHMRIEQFLFSMAGGYGSLALYMLLREKVPAVVTELGQQIGKISFFMYLNEWYVLNWIGNKNSVPRDLWGVAVILVSTVMAVVTEKCWKLFVEGVQTLAKNGVK